MPSVPPPPIQPPPASLPPPPEAGRRAKRGGGQWAAIIVGAVFTLAAAGIAVPSVLLTQVTIPFLVTTKVEPDGQVHLDPGAFVIIEPEDDAIAFALIATDDQGRRLEVDQAPWPVAGSDPPPVLFVEEPGVVSFDSDGRQVRLGRSNQFTVVFLVILVVMWATVAILAVGGLALLLLGLFPQPGR